MARWKLNAPHYLPIEGTFYEQKAVSNTGRPVTEKWPCHLYLDPNDPTQTNAEDEATGERIVVVGTKPYKKDFVLAKEIVPSPDMIPLDDEAAAISARVPTYINPMSEQALPGTIGAAPKLSLGV